MNFKKWPSIENSYRNKYIQGMINYYPDLINEEFVITEKLHGSNFQWAFEPGKEIRAGSRNNYLDMSSSFQGASINRLLEADQDLLTYILRMSDADGDNWRLFGELIGKGVQKGVDYGADKRILYFGAMCNDDLLPFYKFNTLMIDAGARELMVPIVAVVENLQEALKIDTKFDSVILQQENNICEGVVIQPLHRVYPDAHGSPFMLKKKNDEFEEKQKAPRPVVVDSEVQALNLEFRSYINENRLQSLFSKEGDIQEPKQIGLYIKLMLEDAKIDFLKDFGDEFELLDKKQQKGVLNVGSTIANMLKNYL